MAPLWLWPRPSRRRRPARGHRGGRFTYIDDAGQPVGIRFATVEMCDADQFGCSIMGTTTTDANGNFTFVGSGGDDFGDLPDVSVRVLAASRAGRTGNSAWPHRTYCHQSSTFNNRSSGSLPLGTISTNTGSSCYAAGASVAAEAGAWQLHNNIEEAWRFTRTFSLTNPGVEAPQVDVRWPSGSSAYLNSLIGIASGDEWDESIIWHEYGHHVMGWLAESPSPNYKNGVCDTPSFWWFEGGGHCMWMPEVGSIHFTEGWASYFADTVATTFSGRNLWSLENTVQPPLTTDKINTEGYTAAILWDLHDAAADNRDSNSSRDRLAQGFATQWDVLMDFDPAPADPSHNHPTSIVEFFNGVRSMFPSLANRLSAIYDENEILGFPRANLTTTVTNPPAAIVRGNRFGVTGTVRNSGTVDAGESSSLELFLSTNTTFELPGAFPGADIALVDGTTMVSDVKAGQGLQVVTTVVVPGATPPGEYHVIACTDLNNVIFESSDLDNCTASTRKVKVKAVTPARQITVWRPSSGEWFTFDRQTGSSAVAQLGARGDVPVAADYDGDGRDDRAVYLPSGVGWHILRTSTGALSWVPGTLRSEDVPVPADYDGDGKAETAVWRPSDGGWRYVDSSTGEVHEHHWGQAGDVPVPADYDGDGKDDQAVWRASEHNWYVISSSTGVGSVHAWFGDPGDVPVPADYDGDGRDDVAVWRPTDGNWYVLSSLSGGMLPAVKLGQQGDVPVPADQDGDGKADRIVFGLEPCSFFKICRYMQWAGIETATGTTWGTQWGVLFDVPIPRKVG